MHYMNMTSKFDGIGVTCTRLRRFTDTFSQWNSCWKIKKHLDTWQKTKVVTRCPSLLPHSHCSTPPCGGAFAWCNHFVIYFASNEPTDSCRFTTRIPWYHQKPAFTHRILFARTAWYWKTLPCYMIQKWLPIASFKYENRVSLYYFQSIAHLTFLKA